MTLKKQMQALFLMEDLSLQLKTIPVPTVTKNDILIKVDSCAICGSDLRTIKHGNDRIKLPWILGHEIAGTVVKVGRNQPNYKINDRISLCADIPIKPDFAFGYEYQGGFAEYLLLTNQIIQSGAVTTICQTDVTQDELALAEPLACCLNGIAPMGVLKYRPTLILGAGPMGVLLTKLAKFYGTYPIVLADIDPEQLMGATDADAYVLISDNNLREATTSLTNNKGFDRIFTACSSLVAQETALQYIAKKGIINFFGGLPKGTKPIKLNTNEIHYKELQITGTHGSTIQQQITAIYLITSKQIIVKDLIKHRFPLSEYKEAFNQRGKTIINP